MSTLNINQFAQLPVRGEQDLSIARSGVLSGVVSAAQATPLKAGDAVIIDPAITTVGGVPQFIAAANADVAFGYVLLDPKLATIPAPVALQVLCRSTGPVVWLVAAATIPPGSPVEQVLVGGDVQVLAAGKLRGIALDYATVGQLVRILLTPALA